MKSFTVSSRMVRLFACSLFMVSGWSVQAQEADSDPAEIIVSANRLSQPADIVMAGTTIIDRDAIRASLAQNMVDLLSGLPGMQLAPSGGQGAQTSLFLRGTESDHTLILVDGVQISPSTGPAGRLEFLPLDQIERIEIVRGPRSSVYGSEAIGGVINIITHRQPGGLQGGLRVLAGTEQSRDVNADLALGNDTTAVSVNLSHRETNGIDFSQSGDPDDDSYENDSFSVSLNQRLGQRAGFDASYAQFQAESDYDDGEIETDNQTLSTGVSVALTNFWLSRLSLTRFAEDSLDVGAFGTTDSHSENRQLSWHNGFTLGAETHLVLGYEHQEQELRYTTFGAVQTATERDNDGIYGVYLYDGRPWDLTLSLRNDDNEEFGNHSTGSVALGRDLGDTTRAWISYGTAFKAPNLIDLYVDFPAFFFFANPDLEPETAQNLELGLSWRGLGARWQLNLFRNEIEDLITTDASFTTLANVQEARIDGAEATVATEWLGWQLDAALTVLEHENRSNGAELLRRPDQTLSFNAARDFGALNLALQWLGQSDHRDLDPVSFGPSVVGGYAVLNLVAGYRLGEALTWRLRVGNLLDRDYQIVDGFNTLGRNVQLSMDYRF